MHTCCVKKECPSVITSAHMISIASMQACPRPQERAGSDQDHSTSTGMPLVLIHDLRHIHLNTPPGPLPTSTPATTAN